MRTQVVHPTAFSTECGRERYIDVCVVDSTEKSDARCIRQSGGRIVASLSLGVLHCPRDVAPLQPEEPATELELTFDIRHPTTQIVMPDVSSVL